MMNNLNNTLKAFVQGFVVLLIVVLLSSCGKDDPAVQPPSISSFDPPAGVVGATIKITGTNFSSITSENKVSMNGTAAAVSTASKTEITAAVPTGATSGKITVTVNGLVATSNNDFTVLSPPTFTSFSPAYGLPGSSVTITGTNFNATPANNTVTVNNITASITSASTTQLVITIPANAANGKVAITVNGITVTSATDFEVLKDIPRSGLVAFYPFTGNGQCVNNSVLNLAVGGPGQPTLTTDRLGQTSQALDFAGDQVSQISQNVLPNRPWTVCVWMDPGTFNHNAIGFVSFYQSYGLFLRLQNGTSGDFYIQGPLKTSVTSLFNSLANTPPTRYIAGDGLENEWFLICLTYDGSTFKVYKDNLEVYSSPADSETPTPNIFVLGACPSFDDGYEYVGKLDDLIIYNRVLTSQELTQVFQQTISKY
jgi:hypothetical protein